MIKTHQKSVNYELLSLSTTTTKPKKKKLASERTKKEKLAGTTSFTEAGSKVSEVAFPVESARTVGVGEKTSPTVGFHGREGERERERERGKEADGTCEGTFQPHFKSEQFFSGNRFYRYPVS